MHRVPSAFRTRFVSSHLPAEGAWWLRERVEGLVPIELGTTVAAAREKAGRLVLTLRDSTGGTDREIQVDHVISGSGYVIDVDRLDFLASSLRGAVERIARAPRLNASFETSVPGLRFVGPASAMSFGPLFRFVVGAEYTARIVTTRMSSQIALAA
jgi:FAD-dependent urate hydroxylase